MPSPTSKASRIGSSSSMPATAKSLCCFPISSSHIHLLKWHYSLLCATQYANFLKQLHMKILITISHWSGSTFLKHHKYWNITQSQPGCLAVAQSQCEHTARQHILNRTWACSTVMHTILPWFGWPTSIQCRVILLRAEYQPWPCALLSQAGCGRTGLAARNVVRRDSSARTHHLAQELALQSKCMIQWSAMAMLTYLLPCCVSSSATFCCSSLSFFTSNFTKTFKKRIPS